MVNIKRWNHFICVIYFHHIHTKHELKENFYSYPCSFLFRCWYLNFSQAKANLRIFCRQSAAASCTASSSEPKKGLY